MPWLCKLLSWDVGLRRHQGRKRSASATEKPGRVPSWLVRGPGLARSGSRAERQGKRTRFVHVAGGRQGVALGAGRSPRSGGSSRLGARVVQGGCELLSRRVPGGTPPRPAGPWGLRPPASGTRLQRTPRRCREEREPSCLKPIRSSLLSTLGSLTLDTVELIVVLPDNPSFFLPCVWWHCQCRRLPKNVGKRVILALLVDKLCLSHGISAELFRSG